MKALVKNTGHIVELVTKRGEYYIDTNSNPYKESELNFDVPSDAIPDFQPMPEFSTILGFGNLQHSVLIAVQYMKDHPTAMPVEVGHFVQELMFFLKKV